MFSKVSIRTRLTLLFLAISGTTLVVFGVVTYNFLSKSLMQEFDDALYNYAVDVSESVTLNPSGNLDVGSADVDQAKIYPFALGTALIQIRHISGAVLTRVGNFGDFQIPFRQDFQNLARGVDVTYRTVSKLNGLPQAEATTYRILSFPLDNSPVPQLILQIAVPLTFFEAQISSRKILFELGIPIIILISMLAGYFLSGRALAPVNEIVQKARNIEAKALSERLPVPESKDEIQSLALTLNQMLGRIEQAFQSQERFIADASHQLLTPLTIMKGEMEQSLKAGAIDKEILESSLEEVQHLTSLVKNLLVLARVDAGLGAMSFQKIHFEEVVLDSIARAEKMAKSRDIRLKFDIQTLEGDPDFHPEINADSDLLQNLTFNLIENAIKYSPDSSVVTIRLSWTRDEQVLCIEDVGPGIPAESLSTIFDRFSRGPNVRQRQGYGLGLAIAKQIALAHNGEISVQNRIDTKGQTQGAIFQFRIKNI